jgi:hypothetical protein
MALVTANCVYIWDSQCLIKTTHGSPRDRLRSHRLSSAWTIIPRHVINFFDRQTKRRLDFVNNCRGCRGCSIQVSALHGPNSPVLPKRHPGNPSSIPIPVAHSSIQVETTVGHEVLFSLAGKDSTGMPSAGQIIALQV